MRALTVVLQSSDPQVAALLRERAPDVDWTDHHADPDVTISDDGSGTLSVVGRGTPGGEPMTIDKNDFVRSPAAMLQLVAELAKQARELESARRELEVARHIRELMSIGDFAEVYERITRAVLGLVRAQSGTLLLHDSLEERFVARFNSDPSYKDEGEYVPGVPAELVENAVASGAGHAVGESVGGRIVVFPIRHGEDLIGIVRVPLAGPSLPQHLDDAARYLTEIGHVLSNMYLLTRSQDLAMLDDLTRAYNRRFFETYLDEEIERSRRYGSVLSIIFLDLDDLKLINNQYGHLAGSRTLQEVAKRILLAVRSIDKVIRFGGDEFCIILPQTDQEQARHVANRVKKSLSDRVFEVELDAPVRITASFGVASYPTHAQTKEELIRQADTAMFLVKSTTKNSIQLAEGDDRPIHSAVP